MTPTDADLALDEIGARLVIGIEAALAPWVSTCVEKTHVAWNGSVPSEVSSEALDAGRAAVAEVVPQLRTLLAADVDQQWTNPLHLLRQAARYPTQVLLDAGVPPVVRDDFDEQNSPSDVYGLEPAGFADIDTGLHELGLEWGAAKAMAHLLRRRFQDQNSGHQ